MKPKSSQKKKLSPDQVFILHGRVVDLLRVKNQANLMLGDLLLDIIESEGHKIILGEDRKASIESYLGLPEIKQARTTVFRYIGVVKKYIRELGLTFGDLEGLDIHALDMCAKVVTKENIDEWLGRIETLSRSDLKILVKEEIENENKT